MKERVAPYGSWQSPITEAALVEGRIGIRDACLDQGTAYWLESRPQEGGRVTIMRRVAGQPPQELLPAPFSARTTVHEYGGAAMLADKGTVYFSNYSDQRIWILTEGREPQPLTPEVNHRYADAVIDSARKRLICVRENHDVPKGEPSGSISGLTALDAARRGALGLLWSHPPSFSSQVYLTHEGPGQIPAYNASQK